MSDFALSSVLLWNDIERSVYFYRGSTKTASSRQPREPDMLQPTHLDTTLWYLQAIEEHYLVKDYAQFGETIFLVLHRQLINRVYIVLNTSAYTYAFYSYNLLLVRIL